MMILSTTMVEVIAYTLGAAGSWAILKTDNVKDEWKIFGIVMAVTVLIFFFGDTITNLLLQAFKP